MFRHEKSKGRHMVNNVKRPDFNHSSSLKLTLMSRSRFTGKHHKRRHSWPPLHIHSQKHVHAIDENPFEFFISTPESIGADVEDDLTAGIGATPRSRSLSPSRLHTTATSPLLESVSSPIARLKRWIERMEQRYIHHRQIPIATEPTISPKLSTPEPSSPKSPTARGRRDNRLSPKSGMKRSVRSHSGRPRIWIEPGEDIWPVAEEQEEVGLGISL